MSVEFLKDRIAKWQAGHGQADIKPSIDWVIIGWREGEMPRPERVIEAMRLLQRADCIQFIDASYLVDRKGNFEPVQMIAARAVA